MASAISIAGASCATGGAGVHAPSGSKAASWRYEVVVQEQARELWIDAWLPRGSLADLVVRRGAEGFVRDVEVQHEDGWREVAHRGIAVHVPECALGCHVRYRFLLRAAAEALHDTDMAVGWGPVLEASPAVWLLHPTLAPAGARYRLHVHTFAGSTFATGVFAAEDGPPDTYEAEASNLGAAPYAAFGTMRMRHVDIPGGATIDVAIASASYAVSDDALVAWVAHSARTMGRFLGCFPLERVMVLVVPADGKEVAHGETMGDGGASIVVDVGLRADDRALLTDWVLPHEMIHLAVPSVSRRHHWIEEGIAVYSQPIARARAGELSPRDVWHDFATWMPKGAAAPGDRGLDDSSSWARTYWGGATFCLLADVEIRRQTGNRLGFEDALRGILASGGSVAQIWDFERLLETADAAVGAPVLRRMRDQFAREPWRVDLPGLFRDLGVVVRGDDVELLEDAPLSAVRRAITEPLAADAPEPTACRWAAPGRMAQR
jgi:hypothetical protein